MIVTFYSFKGGVGRSMAMANVAEILADAGYRVVACDWDLEAPGLERYLAEGAEERPAVIRRPGIMDLVLEYKQSLTRPPEEAALQAGDFQRVGSVSIRKPSGAATAVGRGRDRQGSLRLITAGRRDGDYQAAYADAVQSFDWTEFYDKWAGGAYLEFFREELCESADVVLVDSRTGVTEHGGVCTHHLADLVVLCTAANDLNLDGIEWMAMNLKSPELAQMRGQRRLEVMPVAARIEQTSEKDEKAIFRKRLYRRLGRFVPPELGDPKQALMDTEIPYMPFYSFEERVAAREEEGQRDEDLYRSYQKIADAIVVYGVENELLEPRHTGRWRERELGTDVRAAIDLHREWLETGGDRGRRADFSGGDVGRVDLTNVLLDNAVVDTANLRGARMTEARLNGASLRRSDLSFANLRAATLAQAQMQGVVMVGANAEECDLSRTELSGADLESANLREANLAHAELRDARMNGARLQSADLTRASCAGADFTDAHVERARLDGADCTDADFTGAFGLDEASFAGADLTGARGYRGVHPDKEAAISARLYRFLNVSLALGVAAFAVLVAAIVGMPPASSAFDDYWLLTHPWLVPLVAVVLGSTFAVAGWAAPAVWLGVEDLPGRFPDGATPAGRGPWLLKRLGSEIGRAASLSAVPVGLTVAWLRYLVTHDAFGVAVLAAVTIASAAVSLRAIARIRRGAHARSGKIGMRFAIAPAIVLSFLTILTIAVLAGAALPVALDRVGLRTFAVLSSRSFPEARLEGKNLQYARMLGTTLENANLAGANLRGAFLRGANLSNSDLSSADLAFADLSRADLGGSILEDARLEGANLRGTTLSKTDLRGADLRGVKGLCQQQLDTALTDTRTLLSKDLPACPPEQ